MSLYRKLKIENEYNAEAIEKIENLAAEAIENGVKYYEHAVSSTDLDDEGRISLTFVEGQGLDRQDIAEAHESAQNNFEEKFAELIGLEAPEVR